MDAMVHTIGNGKQKFNVWYPAKNSGNWSSTLIEMAIDLVLDTRELEQDSFTVNLTEVGWDGVVAKEIICPESCPDVILLGTTQLANRLQKKVKKKNTYKFSS
ncbi:hypothetical protein HK099_001021 [Clydaea vesicula]|uniref:Uncharacterized protein n=1 Tax=Clydaea vesicula TaxID=447962 RepID=A0AAD5XW77_9FUNG|nr:hypothetical protein HK099_001021 [Clydaea vesicula]